MHPVCRSSPSRPLWIRLATPQPMARPIAKKGKRCKPRRSAPAQRPDVSSRWAASGRAFYLPPAGYRRHRCLISSKAAAQSTRSHGRCACNSPDPAIIASFSVALPTATPSRTPSCTTHAIACGKGHDRAAEVFPMLAYPAFATRAQKTRKGWRRFVPGQGRRVGRCLRGLLGRV